MIEQLSLEEFLENKLDFSPYLVHLTKDGLDVFGDTCVPAGEVLYEILKERTLIAVNHFCLFSPNLNEEQNNSISDKFKVVCFTETPVEHIDVLLKEVIERNFKPKPYGLIFEKEYIRENGGNSVFYVTKEIAKPLWQLYWPLFSESMAHLNEKTCGLLSLVTVCEKGNDWHWEREWRIKGNLEFKLKDIYCGLCPESEIPYFETEFHPVKFISPYWKRDKILKKGVGK